MAHPVRSEPVEMALRSERFIPDGVMLRYLAAIVLMLAVAAMPALAHPPRGLVVDKDGGVWFSDLRRIWRISPDQKLQQMRPAGDRHTHELMLDSTGNVHGEDSTYDPATQTYRAALWKISPGGKFEFVVEPTTQPTLGLSIWRDSKGRTYFTDQVKPGGRETLLVRRDVSSGREILDLLLGPDNVLRRRGYPQLLSNIGGSTFDAHGAFIFRHGAVLRRVTSRGGVLVLSRALPDENFGIAAEASGAVLVAHFGGAQILRFAGPTREVVATSEPPWRPTGVAVRGATIYALEADQDERGVTKHLRVRRLTPQAVILATVPVD
jgi:hypothetical protein